MINTTYTCDRCNKIHLQMGNCKFISININSDGYGAGVNRHTKLWCEDCIKATRINTHIPPIQPEPTFILDDYIREIIKEEINATH